MAFYKKRRSNSKEPTVTLNHFLPLVSVTIMFLTLTFFLKQTSVTPFTSPIPESVDVSVEHDLTVRIRYNCPDSNFQINRNNISLELEKRNKMPPRNTELYPTLSINHIPIVLYVHNRPEYLKIVLQSLSQVSGINETLLIISHDGYFEQMNEIVDGIIFCQVKQIFAPFSPHIFPNTFPGVSPDDCKNKDNVTEKKCNGNPDQYGNHRSPKFVSLKHHWWWMMNTVWNGLKETKYHSGHIVFIEEDHFIFPNAYKNLQLLASLKSRICPECYAINLAPSDVHSRGEGVSESLIAEKIGNIGYAFNRTIWNKIHKKAEKFCLFDDYNWDVTMASNVYPSLGDHVYSLRGSRTSAVHFGKCGLHQGRHSSGGNGACVVNGDVSILIEEDDRVVNIDSKSERVEYGDDDGYRDGFKGWGGWGDERDRQLCLSFSKMYKKRSNNDLPCL